MREAELPKSSWCIIVGDDSGLCWPSGSDRYRLPVQYRRFGDENMPLRRALQRAVSVTLPSQIVLAAREEHRCSWEPMAWFVRPERRFICDGPLASQLATAAAILAVAARSPTSIVTMMPARCYVANESILNRALNVAMRELAAIPEGVVTFGMLDADEGIDESYMIVSPARRGNGFDVDGFARRPVSWVARHLKAQGALVASNIRVGYAGVFAAHLTKHWPSIASQLEMLCAKAASAGGECVLPSVLYRQLPKSLQGSFRWDPPAFKQRVFMVCRCGWSGLRSPRAVARVADYLCLESETGNGETTRSSSPSSDGERHSAVQEKRIQISLQESGVPRHWA